MNRSEGRSVWLYAALVGLVLAAVSCAGSDGGRRGAAVDELRSLYAAADYFELQERLDTLEMVGPWVAFLRAAAAHAFNDPVRSNRYLTVLDASEEVLPDTLRGEAARLRFRNHLRLGEYREAAEVAQSVLALPMVDSATRADVTNEARIMEALADTPPQRLVARRASEVHRRADGRVPVTIGDSVRGYVFDTGANLSTLMRSEAEALGLETRAAAVEVGTSTGATVTADVAVAPRLRIGGVELASVVFLVVPDAMLTFGPDFRIPGIIGFPVIEALGEVEFRRGGVIRIPGDIPARSTRNLAMDYLTPLIRVRVLGDDAICELDTGANVTSLHLPIFRRRGARIRAEGRLDTIRTAGAGGERRIPVWVLDSVRVGLADTAAVLDHLSVYTESVASPGERDADCRLGLDALAGFDGYLINLRSMTFLPL